MIKGKKEKVEYVIRVGAGAQIKSLYLGVFSFNHVLNDIVIYIYIYAKNKHTYIYVLNNIIPIYIGKATRRVAVMAHHNVELFSVLIVASFDGIPIWRRHM